MKPIRTAVIPAALAMSLLTGCGYYARAWQAEQDKQQHANVPTADSTADSTKEATEATVMQQGEPREEKAEKTEKKAEARSEEAKAQVLMSTERARRRKEDRLREDLARETPEARETRLWQLNQDQIDDLLDGADSDGHMLGIFLMSNDVDLSFAKLAYRRSENQDVKAYAKRMLTDHTQMIATLKTLIEDHDIVPADNMLGRDLRDLASIQRDSVMARDGLAFDRAYVRWEIGNHKELLAIVDEVLLPRASAGELREMVATMRPIISAHLAHAEQIQSALGRR
jgi:putative membrane protein